MERSTPVIDQKPPRLIDYHMHTGVTVDSVMKETEACERALSLGIHEIAFTNHIMLNQPDHRMSSQACLVHWERIQACQKQYPDLSIRLGLRWITTWPETGYCRNIARIRETAWSAF
jgi:hypothetical protein